MSMYTSSKGIKLIKESESLFLEPYLDPINIPTIGYGNTYYEDDTKVTMNDKPITKERAEELLRFVLERYEKGVERYVQVPISQNQFDALVSFVYNVGLNNLRTSTLLKKLNAGLYKEAAEQFPRWNKSGGKVLRGLTIRRRKEKELFLSGDNDEPISLYS